MNTYKIWTKLLMASTLLGLLFTAACGFGSAIDSPEEKALAGQGDAMMTVIMAGDLQAIYGVMSFESQQMVENATSMASGIVNVERLVAENAPKITTWEFDRARIYTEDSATWGRLDGKVEYVDGESGVVHMNLVKQDGPWKLSGWTITE
jgi:hypothetical protein